MREWCIGYLEDMLDKGYLLVGNIVGNTLVPLQKSVTQTMEALQVLWPVEGGIEKIRDSAWLANNELGEEIAKKYLTDRTYPAGL